VAWIASVSSFASLVAFAGVNAALLILRWRDPARDAPFRVPLTWGRVAVLPALGFVSSLALVTQLDRHAITTGSLLLLGTLGVYAVMRLRRRRG
jgi:APA family basic amino acid/polyamine antiporter